MTKRKYTLSLAAILILLLIATTAVAAAVVSGGYVGWDGIYHPYEESDKVTPSAQSDDQYFDLLAAVPNGEYWEVTKDGNMMNATANSRNIREWDSFVQMIEGTKLPIPTFPDGYVFFGVSFQTEPEEKPYSKSTLEDGVVLAKYKTKEPVAGEVKNYTLNFCKPNGGNLHSITAQIVPAQDRLIDDSPVAYLRGDESVESVEIDGFDYAICIRNPMGFTQLHMLQPMGEEMLIVDTMTFEDLSMEAILNLFPAE